jgi:hypothetical protein
MSPREDDGNGTPVLVRFAPGLKVSLDREPVKFVLHDCFRMGVAVGAGLTLGAIAVACAITLTGSILRHVFGALFG